MANDSGLGKYAQEQAEYYERLTPAQLKVNDELQAYANRKISDFETKKNQVTSEVNEYERHFSGYFALAISFIVSGLLANVVKGHDSKGAREFFFIAIVTSLVAALLLFLEYILTYKLFNSWQKNIEQAIEYIYDQSWSNPNALEAWLKKHQEIPERSTRYVRIAEIILMSIAFISLGSWLYIRLFTY